MTLTIRPATTADLQPAILHLESAGLPVADLTADRLALVAERDDVFCGVVGLQAFGAVGLLRSLVVTGVARRSGIGPALVTALEVAAAADGMRELWLLTIDAEGFFSKLGYVARSRDDAPAAIQGSEEFASLCPGDAVLMSKGLQ